MITATDTWDAHYCCMEWVYAAFVVFLAFPVALAGLAFLLLLWNKPFAILAALWAGGLITVLVLQPDDAVKLLALSAGLALTAVWLAAAHWRKPRELLWRFLHTKARRV